MEPFEVVEPQGGESPLLVEVPHAGLWLDPEALAFTIAPARSIARDADLYVDRLFQDAPSEGATLVVANTSRFVVDLNRGEDDWDGEAVEGGGRAPWPRGLVWRLTTDGDPILAERLPRRELERRLELVYRPYHRAVEAILERKLARFGFAVLLCAHSMPSQGRGAHPDAGSRWGSAPNPGPAGSRWGSASGPAGSRWGSAPNPGPAGSFRADLVPGTRGRTTSAGVVIDRVDAHGRARGWTVRHDDPYRGGFSTAHYGKPAQGVHAVQIEIARRRYMDEATLRIDPQGFRAVREFARTLAARLAFSETDAPRRLLQREPAASRT